MARVAYLFGAGASANALPVVAQIAARIEAQLAWLDSKENELPEKPLGQGLENYTHGRALKDYCSELAELHRALKVNPRLTIDTHARAVQRKDRFKARQLKAVMTLFFAVEQQMANAVDWRYDQFFNSLVGTREHRLPGHVVLLTWNYDQQIAMSLGQLTGSDSVLGAMDSHKICTLRSLERSSHREYQVLHLNGIAGYHWQRDEIPTYDGLYTRRTTTERWHGWLRSFGLTFYLQHFQDLHPLLEYAWDLEDDLEAYLDHAKTPLTDVERLIVVGYSFPAYNRRIDIGLLRRMPKLRRLTIQVRDKRRGEELRERLEEEYSPLTGKVKILEGCDQFLLPEEIHSVA